MHPVLLRFLRYESVGISTFLLDLALLYAATTIAGIPYYYATFVCFLIAVSLNYAISRPFAFHDTKRLWHHGYFYFIGIALGGALITTVGVVGLVNLLALPYLLARILVSGFVGIANYLVNLRFNFRVA